MLGIVSPEDALRIAEEHNLDLVEIAPTAAPPVCKIMDFGKYRYQLQMKDRENKKKQHVVKLKEVRFRPRIGEHDLNMKINHIRKFLLDGYKVKITLMFRGRELAHKEVGMELVNSSELTHKEVGIELVSKIVGLVSDISELYKAPSSEGRTIITFLTAK